MRRPRDVALYVAAAISGFAVAYVLRQWRHHLCTAQRALPDPNNKNPDDEAPPPATSVPGPTHTDPEPHIDRDTQTKSLPPLRTHSLPPPLPNLLSGSFVSIAQPTISSTSSEDAVSEESAAQTDTSDSDSFIDLLSPAPTHVVSRRRSMRAAHDLFAESHISFAELGSLVAPQDETK